jgi:hypothetical protein
MPAFNRCHTYRGWRIATNMSQDSSVTTVTDYELDEKLRFTAGVQIVPSPPPSGPVLDSNQLPIQWVPRVKRQIEELPTSLHSLSSWSCASISPSAFMAKCLTNRRESFPYEAPQVRSLRHWFYKHKRIFFNGTQIEQISLYLDLTGVYVFFCAGILKSSEQQANQRGFVVNF